MEITLHQLLDSRDERSALQRSLIVKHPTSTLVCLTVIMPGTVKRNYQSFVVANAALTSLSQQFGEHIKELVARDLVTGYEAYVVTDIDARQAKQIACEIEDSHTLGRLFDIDVIAPGDGVLSRSALGAKARKCLLCDNEARFCMRNHSHTYEELQQCITQMIDDYVR